MATVDLPQLDARRSLSDAVFHALREAITDGRLAPGTRLREVALARQLGVSPTPVREALRRLEHEGLVTATSHRGAIVADVSAETMADLYELHEVLETFAVRRAAERGPHDLAPVEAVVEEIAASLELADQVEFNRLDLHFHRLLNELSGNAQIAEMAEQTHRRIQAARVRLDIHLPDRPRQSQAQHRALLDAIDRGDAAEAERLARAHIRAVREPVLAMMKGGSTLES